MGTHDEALARLHNKHAEIHAMVNDMHDLLALKVNEGQERTRKMMTQQQDFEQQKREWIEEMHALRGRIESSAELAREKDAQLHEARICLDAAQHEKAVLLETLREREQFITSMISEKEDACKFQIQEFVDCDAPQSDDDMHRKFAIDQMEQVRMTAKYLDAYATDITKAINELAGEVRSIEECQGNCEATMLQLSSGKPEHACASTSSQSALIQSLCDDVGALQSQTIDLANKLQTCEARLQKSNDENSVLRTQIHHLGEKLLAQQTLVAKYQESSHCGTQTIDTLQQSIATLTTQHEEERHAMQRQIEDLSMAAIKADHVKQSEEEVHRTKQLDMENALADKAARIQQLEAQVQELETQAAMVRCRQSTSHIVDEIPATSSSPQAPIPPPSSPAKDVVPMSPQIRPSSVADDGPVDEGPAVVAANVCLACREEPFGFMVRCQKCKHQFHAGCVRSKRQKTSRVGCYVFVCEACEVL